MEDRESDGQADARLIMMAVLLEVEPNSVARFLDRLISEPELTEHRDSICAVCAWPTKSGFESSDLSALGGQLRG
jgi:hypothetical protein